MRNLFYHDLTMTNVQMSILIYSHYRAAGGANKISHFTPARVTALHAETVVATTPIWRDITFSNITATGTVAGCAIWGRPEMCVTNVNFVNVDINASGPFNIYSACEIRFQDCRIQLKDGKQNLPSSMPKSSSPTP